MTEDGVTDPGFGESHEMLTGFAGYVIDVKSNPHWNIKITCLPNVEKN